MKKAICKREKGRKREFFVYFHPWLTFLSCLFQFTIHSLHLDLHFLPPPRCVYCVLIFSQNWLSHKIQKILTFSISSGKRSRNVNNYHHQSSAREFLTFFFSLLSARSSYARRQMRNEWKTPSENALTLTWSFRSISIPYRSLFASFMADDSYVRNSNKFPTATAHTLSILNAATFRTAIGRALSHFGISEKRYIVFTHFTLAFVVHVFHLKWISRVLALSCSLLTQNVCMPWLPIRTHIAHHHSPPLGRAKQSKR